MMHQLHNIDVTVIVMNQTALADKIMSLIGSNYRGSGAIFGDGLPVTSALLSVLEMQCLVAVPQSVPLRDTTHVLFCLLYFRSCAVRKGVAHDQVQVPTPKSHACQLVRKSEPSNRYLQRFAKVNIVQ